METLITKSDGTLAPFDPKKILTSIQRTGADSKTADAILGRVETRLKRSMPTSHIYRIVREELAREKPWAAMRYHLREAIIRLGPAGFNFEKYVASVLTVYGYKTALPENYQGACILHEIDVTAEKDGRTAFIEAKFRRDFRTNIVIKDTLATWARFLDLVDGGKLGLCPHFDEAWIVTNARFSDQSLQYGHCKNIMLIGWNHPHERTFANMVDREALYPLTILPSLKAPELQQFARANIMLCREVCELPQEKLAMATGLTEKRLTQIVKECEQVVKGHMA